MPDDIAGPSSRPLEPAERVAEALFGLIMVLTFTGSLSVAEAGRDDVRTMLIGALGCNIAWGIIDGILYLMSCLSEQGRDIRALPGAPPRRDGPEDGAACHCRRRCRRWLPLRCVRRSYEPMRQRLAQLPERAPCVRDLGRSGVARRRSACFCWVFVMTLPVVVPFIFMHEPASGHARLQRHSHRTCCSLPAYAFGRVSEYRPWLTGVAMVVLGAGLVGLTIALGG